MLGIPRPPGMRPTSNGRGNAAAFLVCAVAAWVLASTFASSGGPLPSPAFTGAALSPRRGAVRGASSILPRYAEEVDEPEAEEEDDDDEDDDTVVTKAKGNAFDADEEGFWRRFNGVNYRITRRTYDEDGNVLTPYMYEAFLTKEQLDAKGAVEGWVEGEKGEWQHEWNMPVEVFGKKRKFYLQRYLARKRRMRKKHGDGQKYKNGRFMHIDKYYSPFRREIYGEKYETKAEWKWSPKEVLRKEQRDKAKELKFQLLQQREEQRLAKLKELGVYYDADDFTRPWQIAAAAKVEADIAEAAL